MGRGFQGAHPFSGPIDEATALTVSTYWACVSLIADDLAAVPWRAIRREGEDRYIDDQGNPDWLLHRQANPEMTAFSFRQLLSVWVLTRGNAFAEIERDQAGRPIWLWPVEPWRVRPVRIHGELMYEIRNFTLETSYIPAEDMLHFKGLGDGLMGFSVLEAAARNLRLAVGQDKYAADTADPAKQTQVGGVLKVKRRLDDEARARLKDDFDKRHKGKPGSIPILEEDMDFIPHKLASPHDLQLIESQKWTAERICQWFKVPPHKVGLLDRATNNNIEHQGIEYVTTCLVPWAVRNEQEADLKLFGPRQMITRYTKYNLAALMRGDSRARAEFYDRMIRNGVMSINEVRAFEELNPVAYGTTLFVPAQWNTLERAAKGEPVSITPPTQAAPESPSKPAPVDPSPEVPNNAALPWLSLKRYLRATILVLVKNAATVTGSAITLKQAKDVTGTGSKPLGFTSVALNLSTSTSDALTQQAVVNNTFTTDTTDAKSLLYAIDVLPESLDVNGGFDCISVGVGNAVAATVTVLAILHGKEGTFPQPSALAD